VFFLGTDRTNPVFSDPESHLLVLGPPRSGKTSSIVIPGVVAHDGPVVVTSTKDDVLNATLSLRRQQGQVWIVDPSGRQSTPEGVRRLRWSFVDAADSLDSAVVVADGVVDTSLGPTHGSSRHWSERSKALLAPLLLAGNLAGLEIGDVVRWVDTRDLSEPSAILHGGGAYRASDIMSGVAQSDPRELSAIFSSVSGALSAYRSESALELGESSNFSPDAFVRSRDTMYIVSPAAVQSTVAPIVVSLIDQIRAASYRAQGGGDRGSIPNVALILDKMANIAPLTSLSSILSEGASQGVTVMGALQDLTQAERRWPAEYRGFLTLFGTTMVLGGIADIRTLRQLSELSGEHLRPELSYSFNDSSQRLTSRMNRQPSVHVRSVMEPNFPVSAIAHLPRGEAMLLEPRVGARQIALHPWYSERDAQRVDDRVLRSDLKLNRGESRWRRLRGELGR
jgi:type IV secretory pathway TraG/TraD family ATPase VirD4